MKAGRYDLPPIYRGCDWLPVYFYWKDLNGNPINLDGYLAFVQTSGGINLNPDIVDPVNGVTLLFLTKDGTANLSLGDQTWDWIWWYNYPTGTKYPPLLFGSVQVREPRTEDFTVNQ